MTMPKCRRAFTLAEVMVAILFISIAFFGYMSLHIRLMHSGQKLEQRQVHREEVGQSVAAQISKARREGVGLKHPDVPELVRVIARAEWTDKNGEQSYRVETYELRDRFGW